MRYKFGKKPARKDPRDLTFKRFRTAGAAVPQAQPGYGYGKLVPSWGILGNDQYGDCVCAAACHQSMLLTAAAGKFANYGTPQALAIYTAVTGFDPHDPATDQGTDLRAMLNYWRAPGIADAAGKLHTIGAYVALTPGNFTELLEALNAFEAVFIGYQMPTTAMDQFNAGQPWDIAPPGAAEPQIEGGHGVIVSGYPAAGMLKVVTWGREQWVTQAFHQKYNDEAYALISADMFGPGQTTPVGFDLAQLRADLAAL